jgi:hypothetical protein
LDGSDFEVLVIFFTRLFLLLLLLLYDFQVIELFDFQVALASTLSRARFQEILLIDMQQSGRLILLVIELDLWYAMIV